MIFKFIKDILGFNKYDIYVNGRKSDLLQDLGYFEARFMKREYSFISLDATVEIKRR